MKTSLPHPAIHGMGARVRYLDLTLSTPEENLACDEALLEACDAAPETAVLRVFESPVPFAVVGYGNRAAVETDLEACATAGVPVLRRMSGGGTVVLGPGCLAYTLVLPVDSHPGLQTVTGTNRLIMERHRAAFESLLGEPVRIQGHTDLTIRDLKFSGNAQRRGRDALLFHGTVLVDFDLPCLQRLLRMPTVQPDYRKARHHSDFLVNIPVSIAAVKAALRQAWGATERWNLPLTNRISHWVNERYSLPAWNHRR